MSASAASHVTVRSGTYKLAIPAPGHVSVAAVEVKVLKHGRGAPPSRVLLDLPNRFGLPEEVRFFYVRRRISTAPLRYELLLVAVNRATGRSSSASASAARAKATRRVSARAAKVQFDAGSILLGFPSRAAFGHTCGSCGAKLPKSTNCKSCWFKRTTVQQIQVVNADTASVAQLGSLVGLLRAGWTTNGDSNLVFGNPTAGTPRDPTLNGGEFDDHRAFGWAPASLRDPGPLMHTVVDDLLTAQPQQIIPALELIGQADLNGNGVLDSAATPGGGSPGT
ncbi:MAG TPA: hypothetical protein VGF74_01965 [Thermoleophilaceae bacterium]